MQKSCTFMTNKQLQLLLLLLWTTFLYHGIRSCNFNQADSPDFLFASFWITSAVSPRVWPFTSLSLYKAVNLAKAPSAASDNETKAYECLRDGLTEHRNRRAEQHERQQTYAKCGGQRRRLKSLINGRRLCSCYICCVSACAKYILVMAGKWGSLDFVPFSLVLRHN